MQKFAHSLPIVCNFGHCFIPDNSSRANSKQLHHGSSGGDRRRTDMGRNVLFFPRTTSSGSSRPIPIPGPATGEKAREAARHQNSRPSHGNHRKPCQAAWWSNERVNPIGKAETSPAVFGGGFNDWSWPMDPRESHGPMCSSSRLSALRTLVFGF